MEHPDIISALSTGYEIGKKDPDLFSKCYNCGTEIFDGDEYYELDFVGGNWCLDCIDEMKRTAEV